MKKWLWFAIITPIILLILNIIIIKFNFDINKFDFLKTPLFNIFNIGFIIFFTGYFTQYNNKRNKQKKIVEDIILKIIILLENEKMYNINNEEDFLKIRITQRLINNRIDLLQSYSNIFDFSRLYNTSKNEFKKYWEMISEKPNDFNYINSMKISLTNQLSIVISNMESIIKLLHK